MPGKHGAVSPGRLAGLQKRGHLSPDRGGTAEVTRPRRPGRRVLLRPAEQPLLPAEPARGMPGKHGAVFPGRQAGFQKWVCHSPDRGGPTEASRPGRGILYYYTTFFAGCHRVSVIFSDWLPVTNRVFHRKKAPIRPKKPRKARKPGPFFIFHRTFPHPVENNVGKIPDFPG